MVRTFIESSFSEINDKNYEYCLLRNFIELPDKIGNDIDMLVNAKHLKEIKNVFINQASNCSLRFLKQKKRDGYLGLYFFSHVSCEIILIDLFYKLQKRWNTYADVQQILGNKISFKQFYVVNPTHEVYTIAMKELLTYGFIRKKYIERFNQIDIENNLFQEVSEMFISKKETASLLKLIKSNEVFKSTIKFFPNIKRLGILKRLKNRLSYTSHFVYSKINDLFSSNPMVCLIGPDGVGKSTMAEALQKACLQANLFKSAKVYHHRFEIIPPLSEVLGKKDKFKNDYNPQFGHVNRVHSWARTMIYILYYFIDFILGWFIILRAKFKNEIIIFDRYYFDFYIQHSYSAVSNRIKIFFYFFIPKPLTTIFLYANPYIVVARKKELTIAQHLKQNEQCLFILKGVVKNPIFLNCNGEIGQNVNNIIRFAFKKIFK